jgi:hypothetical protein
MDTKLTLSFDEGVIRRAKKYAADNNMSLSRLTEYLLNKATASEYYSLEDLPIRDWVNQVAEGEVEYHTKRSRKSAKKSFYDSRK